MGCTGLRTFKKKAGREEERMSNIKEFEDEREESQKKQIVSPSRVNPTVTRSMVSPLISNNILDVIQRFSVFRKLYFSKNFVNKNLDLSDILFVPLFKKWIELSFNNEEAIRNVSV